jgi:hypothetical protein
MAVEKVIKLKVENGEALLNIEELNKALVDTNKQTDNLNATMQNATEAIDKYTGGAASGFKAVISGVKSFLGSLKTMKGILIGTGLGALVVALGSLFTYFTQSSRGADQFAKIMGGVNAAIKVVIDRILLLGESLVSLFSGDFSKAVDGLKKAFTGLGDEIARETKRGAELAEQLDNIEDRERDLIKLRATANKEIAKARLIADDQTKSIQEREKAVRRAFELENNVAKAEQRNAQAYVKYLKDRIALGESTDEDLRQLAEAQAKVTDLQTENLRRNKKLETELKGLRTEAKQQEEEFAKLLKERQDKEKEFADWKANQEKQDVIDRNKRLAEQSQANAKIFEQYRVSLEQFRMTGENALLDELKQAELQYQSLLDLAIKSGQDITAVNLAYEEKKKQIKKKYADEERKRELEQAAKSVELVGQSLGAIAGLVEALNKDNKKNAEKNFKITKALRLAEAIANTAAAVMSQLTVGPAGFVPAGIAAATGAAQIATIAATKFQPEGSGTPSRISTPSVPSTSATASPMIPNIQFAGTENQLAGLLGQPMRAYVVNQDIQSANQLERKIRSSATIGG